MLVIFSQLYICVQIYTPFYLQYIIVVIALVQDFQGGGGYGEGGTIVEGTKGDDFVGVIWGGGTLRPILGNFTIFTM